MRSIFRVGERCEAVPPPEKPPRFARRFFDLPTRGRLSHYGPFAAQIWPRQTSKLANSGRIFLTAVSRACASPTQRVTSISDTVPSAFRKRIS
jgi:hypothetical protein